MNKTHATKTDYFRSQKPSFFFMKMGLLLTLSKRRHHWKLLLVSSKCVFSVFFIVILVNIGPSKAVSTKEEPQKSDDIIVPSSSYEEGVTDRVDKVKAKWKENLWAESLAKNASLPEEQTTTFQNININDDNSSFVEDSISSSRKITVSSAIPNSNQTMFNLSLSPKTTTATTTHIYKRNTEGSKDHRKKVKDKGRNKKGKGKIKGMKVSNTSFNLFQSQTGTKPTKSPQKNIPRTTITADLSQFGQDYYLEYETNSTAKKSKKKKTKNKNKTFGKGIINKSPEEILENVLLSENSTISDRDRATLTADLAQYGQNFYLEYNTDEPLKINASQQFYPKTPVNLFSILQTLAANSQPIQMANPITGPAPSIPLRYDVNFTNRVPVRINPPSSPFLLSFDLDSFVTRMAISLFYSSVAIAPLIYLMAGGIGSLSSLGSLAIAPFTTGRRRRSLDLNEKISEYIKTFDDIMENWLGS